MNTDNNVALMAALNAGIEMLGAEWVGIQRAWRKEDREQLRRAKLAARALRNFLRRVADYHTSVSRGFVETWIAKYLAYCALLRVRAPVVKVPRSLRSELGQTIGGRRKLSWEAEPLAFEWAVATRGCP